MTTSLLFVALAAGSPSYDPTAAAVTWRTGPVLTDGERAVWSAVERHVDTATLFADADFPPGLTPTDDAPTLGAALAFGDARPTPGTFLLYVSPRADALEEPPVLLVPTAGDHPTPAFADLAARLEREGRPVYALALANGFADLFTQAEVVADAIARIKERSGSETVDVLAHGTGGLATAIYLSNTAGTSWGSPAFERDGTRYRGDVQVAVLVGAPLGGLDTPFRWPETSRANLLRDQATAPTVWTTYYPDTWQDPSSAIGLASQDLMPEDGDYFPGFRQIIAQQEPPAPFEDALTSQWSLQRDGWTTRDGGLGTFGESPGLFAVLDAGGDLLGHLAAAGVDPAIEVHLVAGDHPIFWNEGDFLSDWATRQWNGVDGTAADWQACFEALSEAGAITSELLGGEIDGLTRDAFRMGEGTMPSDGWVPVSSALMEDALEARGLVVASRSVLHLPHRDLVRAGLTAGASLAALAARTGDADADTRATRWINEDAQGFYADLLAGAAALPVEDDDVDDDTDRFGFQESCGCDAAPKSSLPVALVALLALRRRR